MNDMKIEFCKWIPLIRTKSDDELKKLVLDFDKGIIFSDRHLRNIDDIRSVFSVLMFMGTNRKTDNTRQDKIYNLLQDDAVEKYFKSIGKTEDEARMDYFKSIGMVYEYLDKQTGVSVNSYPTFFSCNFLSLDETEKFWEFY